MPVANSVLFKLVRVNTFPEIDAAGDQLIEDDELLLIVTETEELGSREEGITISINPVGSIASARKKEIWY